MKILEIKGLILDFFYLALKVSFKLILDIDNKGLKISRIFLKKDFELWLYNKNDILIVVFIINLSKNNSIIKKWNTK